MTKRFKEYILENTEDMIDIINKSQLKFMDKDTFLSINSTGSFIPKILPKILNGKNYKRPRKKFIERWFQITITNWG